MPDIDRTRIATQLQGSNEHREIIYSDADILKSPDLMRKVIGAIGLERLYPKIAAKTEPEARKTGGGAQASRQPGGRCRRCRATC